MNDTNSELSDLMSALKDAPDDKKIMIAQQVGPLLEGILKIAMTFDGILKDYNDKIEPNIKEQIRAIDVRTEKAADAILDACEGISKNIKEFGEEQKKPIQKEINTIYEASNFQDLVSQHANEIRLLITEFGKDMDYFKTAMIKPTAPTDTSFEEHKKERKKRSDAHLLNGPSTAIAAGSA